MKRDKNIGNFLVRSAFQASDYSELLNAHVHDAKQVLSFAKLRKQRDPSELSRYVYILRNSVFSAINELFEVVTIIRKFTVENKLNKPCFIIYYGTMVC